jgi:hypothetical protein
MEDIFEEIHNEFIESEDFLSFIYELHNNSCENSVSPYIYNYEKSN